MGLTLSFDLAQSAKAQPSGGALGATAREAMISIFDRKDISAVDRFFTDQFVQHDPNISDGLAGLRQYAADIAASRARGLESIARWKMAISSFCIRNTKD
jgi:hypothetical protein